MRIKLYLLNVGFEFSLGANRGNLPVTSAMGNFVSCLGAKGYRLTHRTCWRTSGKETKAYPTIRNPINYANRGLPKQERRKGGESLAIGYRA